MPAPCNLCGSIEHVLLFAEGPADTLGIARCCDCGLVFRNAPPSSAQTIEAYRNQSHEQVSEAWIQGRLRAFAPYAALLEKHDPCGRILDIGAGLGFFLHLCDLKGWECHGLDPSGPAAAFAQKHFDLEYTCGTLAEATYPANHFDIITCWNVLDQLPDPKDALTRLHRLLRPGGTVLVRCPNAAFHVPVRRLSQLVTRHLPRLARLDQTVFHLYSFDRRSVSALLAATGFTAIKIGAADLGWTTTHAAGGSRARNALARLTGWTSALFSILSGGNILLAPSFLATAQKPGATAEHKAEC
jgi:2-polyprenyl-3-methyl-5-hydroxy-6-metoxy-1,4-benzoquinol methylase